MTKTKNEDDGAPPHGDPAALGLALEGAEHNPAVAKELRAYLRKQGALAELQAEELKDELVWRHWSLRVRHISDVMKLAFELSLALIFTAIVVGIGIAIWSAANADGLVIDSFNVPAAMAQKGLSGQVVASKMLDRLTRMQDEAISARANSSFSNDWTSDIKVEIPETGVSLGQLMRYLHGWLGHEAHLSGDVYETADGIALSLRLSGQPGVTVTGKTGDLDQVAQKAAEAVYRSAQPYRYSIYLAKHRRTAEAIAVLKADTADGRTNERAWAYNGLAVIALSAGRFDDAAAYARLSIDAAPDLPNPYASLSIVAANLGHDEAAVRLFNEGVAKAQGPGAREWNKVTTASTRAVWRSVAAARQGDYLSAYEEAGQAIARAGGLWTKLQGAYAAASMHDVALARKILAGIDPAGLDPMTMNAATLHFMKAFAAMASNDWQSAAGELEEADRLAPTLANTDASGLAGPSAYHTVVTGPWLAYAYAMFGETDKADTLLKPLPLDCDLCSRMRGNVAAVEHRWADAAHYFAMVSARSPDIPFADSDWGAMLLAKSDLDGAIAKFKVANKKGPHFADPLELWGEALIAKNRSDLALEKFAEADKYAPNWGRLHLKWGEALFYSGRRPEAQKQFAIAAHLDLTPAEKSQLSRVSHV